MDILQDTSYITCISPLSHGDGMAKITLEIFNHTKTTLEVVTAISKGASCSQPGIVLVAETVDEHLVECSLENEDSTNVNVRICHYTCQCICNSGCTYIHIHFYDLLALGLQNVQWKFCDIQVCFNFRLSLIKLHDTKIAIYLYVHSK